MQRLTSSIHSMLMTIVIIGLVGAWLLASVSTSTAVSNDAAPQRAATDGFKPDQAACNPAKELVGWFISNTEARIKNGSQKCTFEGGVASYRKVDAVVDHQEIFDWSTGSIGPGETAVFTVNVPACAAQIDVFYGPVLMTMDGQRYGERLMAGRQINGTAYCSRTCDAGQMTGFTGVEENAVLNGTAYIAAQVEGATPFAVVFDLTGPATMTHVERIAPYFFLGNTRDAAVGWDTTQYPDGNYTLVATYYVDKNSACSSITVRFTVDNTPATALPTATVAPTDVLPTATATATSVVPTATATPTGVLPTATATATPHTGVTLTLSLSSFVVGQPRPAPAGDTPNVLPNIDGFVKPGDIISYTLTLQNRGIALATNVVVTDLFSSDTTFTGISVPAPTSAGTDLLSWVIPQLAPDAVWRATFGVVVDETIRGTYTLIYNSATVTSDQTAPFSSNTTVHVYDPGIFPR